MDKTTLLDGLKARFQRYDSLSEAKSWLDENYRKVERLFAEGPVRDFVFEPIKDVFAVQGTDASAQIRSVITRVAVANAVMAGLPGKMGIGVVISMALEGWMAYAIARQVGVQLARPADVWKYFSLLAGVGLTIVFAFKALLGLAFSAFAVIPGINPMIPAELLVTNLVGVLFWVGFQEAADKGSFTIPRRAALKSWKEATGLGKFQWNILRRCLTPANLLSMGVRLRMWLTGQTAVNASMLRGDLVTPLAMAWLVAGEGDRLQGPLGQEFLGAIRDRYPDLADTSVPTIAEHMASYDEEQMAGVVNLIKGRLFERLVAQYENADGDEWSADLHDDQSYPGSDIVFSNSETGEELEVSLKATMDSNYIEAALVRYPEFPIFTTEEVAEHFDGNDMVSGTPFALSHLNRVTQDNFDAMLNHLPAADVAETAAGGVAGGALLSLWPFVIAYVRTRISYEQLEAAFTHVSGEAGRSLAARCAYALMFGPLFAWYLLARGSMGLVKAAESQGATRHLVYHGRASRSAMQLSGVPA